MVVDVILLIAAGVAVLLTLAVIAWALTRAADRIQLATLCLVALVLIYGAAAASVITGGGETVGTGVLLAAYASALYALVFALAIYYKRWAWKASVAAFSLHLVVCLVAAARVNGTAGLSAVAVSFAIGAIGLWACLHPGSRAFIKVGGTPGA